MNTSSELRIFPLDDELLFFHNQGLHTGNGTTQGTNPVSVDQPIEHVWANQDDKVVFSTLETRADVWVFDLLTGESTNTGITHPNNALTIVGDTYFAEVRGSRNQIQTSRGDLSTYQEITIDAEVFSPIVGLDDTAYFFAESTNSSEHTLWRSDGTANGTFAIDADLSWQLPNPILSSLQVLEDQLFFVALDDEGESIWKSNGLAQGTERIASFEDVAGFTDFQMLGENKLVVQRSSKLLFMDFDGNVTLEAEGDSTFRFNDGLAWNDQGNLRWTSDGVQVTTLHSFGGMHPRFLTSDADNFYFEVDETIWASNGTPTGTQIITDYSGLDFQFIRDAHVLDDTLFFSAEDVVNGRELWRLPIEPSPRGDLDFDDALTFADFLVLSSNFGKTADAVYADGDLNVDGSVNFSDFLILSEAFSATNP